MSKFESAGSNGELRSALDNAMGRSDRSFIKKGHKFTADEEAAEAAEEARRKESEKPPKKVESYLLPKLPLKKVADFIKRTPEANPDIVGEEFRIERNLAEKYFNDAILLNKGHVFEVEPGSEPEAEPIFSENSPLAKGIELNVKEVLSTEVAAALNFKDLIRAIENSSGLQGSEHYFEVDYLKEAIDLVRKGAPIEYITRSAGLRDKVAELLLREKMEAANVAQKAEQDAKAQQTSEQLKKSIKADFTSPREAAKAAQIEGTDSFNSLFGKIAEWGGIDEEGRHWEADEIVDQTNEFLAGKQAALLFPNVGGLHDKIYALKKKREAGEEFKSSAKVEKRPGIFSRLFSGLGKIFSRKQ